MLLNKVNNDKEQQEQGQALVEFALTLPILLLLTLGIIDLARLMFAYTHVIDAARQGVRYGIVTGLDRDVHQFLDCDGIEQSVLDLPGLVNPDDTTVDIFYEEARTGQFKTDCVPGLDLWDVDHGDVLAVRVRGAITPLTPVLLMFTDTLPFTYTARRTIVSQGAAYTSEWPEPPPEAKNFTATVDCTLGTNNVSFAWSPMSPIPDRAEIRNSITGETVVVLDDTEPGLVTNAYCNNCATIPQNEGWGMYYLVAVNGNTPSEMAGPPSQDAVVLCDDSGTTPGGGTGTGAISGTVFNDKDGNGVLKTGLEKGISGVDVRLQDAGADGTIGTSDDVFYQTSTDGKGEFEFTGLSVPSGLTGQIYWVEVVRTSPALGSMTPTTAVILEVFLADGQTFPGLLFGFK